jgi:hypothetical protein
MMMIDGSENIIWSVWFMLSWNSSRVWAEDKHHPQLPNFQAKIPISTIIHFSIQHPAHSFHHVLICPDNDD